MGIKAHHGFLAVKGSILCQFCLQLPRHKWTLIASKFCASSTILLTSPVNFYIDTLEQEDKCQLDNHHKITQIPELSVCHRNLFYFVSSFAFFYKQKIYAQRTQQLQKLGHIWKHCTHKCIMRNTFRFIPVQKQWNSNPRTIQALIYIKQGLYTETNVGVGKKES